VGKEGGLPGLVMLEGLLNEEKRSSSRPRLARGFLAPSTKLDFFCKEV